MLEPAHCLKVPVELHENKALNLNDSHFRIVLCIKKCKIVGENVSNMLLIMNHSLPICHLSEALQSSPINLPCPCVLITGHSKLLNGCIPHLLHHLPYFQSITQAHLS
jgi:hypothetical protein